MVSSIFIKAEVGSVLVPAYVNISMWYVWLGALLPIPADSACVAHRYKWYIAN